MLLGFRAPRNNGVWIVKQSSLLRESELRALGARLRAEAPASGPAAAAAIAGVERLLAALSSRTGDSLAVLAVELQDLPASAAAQGEGRSARAAAEYATTGAVIVLDDGSILGPATPALPLVVRPEARGGGAVNGTRGEPSLLVLVPEALWGGGSGAGGAPGIPPRLSLVTLDGFRWKGNGGVFVIDEVVRGQSIQLLQAEATQGGAAVARVSPRHRVPAVGLRLVTPSDCRGGNAGWLTPEVNSGGSALRLAAAQAVGPLAGPDGAEEEERWAAEVGSAPGHFVVVLGAAPAAAFGGGGAAAQSQSRLPIGLVFIAPEALASAAATASTASAGVAAVANASALRARFLALRAVRLVGFSQPGNAGAFGVFGSRGSTLLLGDALQAQGAEADWTDAGGPSCLAALTSSAVTALSRVIAAATAGGLRAARSSASDWARVSGVLAPTHAVVVPPVGPPAGGVLVVVQGPEVVRALEGVCARTPGCDWATAVADSSAGGAAPEPLRSAVVVELGGRRCDRPLLLHLSAVVCITPAGEVGARVDVDLWFSPPPTAAAPSNIHVHLPLAFAFSEGPASGAPEGAGGGAISWGPGAVLPQSLEVDVDAALARSAEERAAVRGGCGSCSNHGVCTQVDVDAGTGSAVRVCVCDLGWAGDHCQQPFLACPGGNDCSFHGACDGLAGACVCDAGWRGDACETPVEPAAHACQPPCCEGGGTCDPLTGRCVCEAGRVGPGCCADVCAPHGAFSPPTGWCNPHPGWHAPKPNETCAAVGAAGCRPSVYCIADRGGEDTCHRHASGCTAAGRCICDPGFGGPTCEGVAVRVGDITYRPHRRGPARRYDAALTGPERAAFLVTAGALDPGVGGAAVALGHIAAVLGGSLAPTPASSSASGGLGGTGGLVPAAVARAAAVMAAADRNRDGALSSNEFVWLLRDAGAQRLVGSGGGLFGAVTARAFRGLDGDGDGSLNVRDLAADALIAGGLLGPATALGAAGGAPAPALVAVAGTARFEPGSETVHLLRRGAAMRGWGVVGSDLEPGAVVVPVLSTVSVSRVSGPQVFTEPLEAAAAAAAGGGPPPQRLRAGQSAFAYRVVRMPSPEQLLPCGNVRAELSPTPNAGGSACGGTAESPTLDTGTDCSAYLAEGDVVLVSGGEFDGSEAVAAAACRRGLAPSRHFVEAVTDRAVVLRPPVRAPTACLRRWPASAGQGNASSSSSGGGGGEAGSLSGITLVRASGSVSGALIAITGPLTAAAGGLLNAPTATISAEVREGDTLVLVGAPLVVRRSMGAREGVGVGGVVLSRKFTGRAPFETRLLALSHAPPAAALLRGPSLGLAACSPGSSVLLFVDAVCGGAGDDENLLLEAVLAPLDVVALRGLRYTVATCAGRRVELFAPVSIPAPAAVRVFRVGLAPAGAVLLPGLVVAEAHSDELSLAATDARPAFAAATAAAAVAEGAGDRSSTLRVGRWGLQDGSSVIVGSLPAVRLASQQEADDAGAGTGGPAPRRLGLAEPFRGAALGALVALPQDPNTRSRLGYPMYRLCDTAPPLAAPAAAAAGSRNSSAAATAAAAAVAANACPLAGAPASVEEALATLAQRRTLSPPQVRPGAYSGLRRRACNLSPPSPLPRCSSRGSMRHWSSALQGPPRSRPTCPRCPSSSEASSPSSAPSTRSARARSSSTSGCVCAWEGRLARHRPQGSCGGGARGAAAAAPSGTTYCARRPQLFEAGFAASPALLARRFMLYGPPATRGALLPLLPAATDTASPAAAAAGSGEDQVVRRWCIEFPDAEGVYDGPRVCGYSGFDWGGTGSGGGGGGRSVGNAGGGSGGAGGVSGAGGAGAVSGDESGGGAARPRRRVVVPARIKRKKRKTGGRRSGGKRKAGKGRKGGKSAGDGDDDDDDDDEETTTTTTTSSSVESSESSESSEESEEEDDGGDDDVRAESSGVSTPLPFLSHPSPCRAPQAPDDDDDDEEEVEQVRAAA